MEDEKEYFHYINKAMNEDAIMTSEPEEEEKVASLTTR